MNLSKLDEYVDSYKEEHPEDFKEKEKETVIKQPQKVEHPLAILDEIKKVPAPEGTHKTIIGGKSVDLFALEQYILKISPYSLRTILGYREIRTLEMLGNSSKRKKTNSKTLLYILIAAGALIAGLAIIFFMSNADFSSMFQGMF